MVRVYLTRLEGDASHVRQSEAAVRLLEAALRAEGRGFSSGGISLRADRRGKPFLEEFPEIQFNISHSGEYVACATADKAVGVDVELRRDRPRLDGLADLMHLTEREIFAAAQTWERLRIFYDLWVGKESYLKATGEGLGLSLDSFCVTDGRNAPDCGHAVNVERDGARTPFSVKWYSLEGARVSLAVCSEDTKFAAEPVWMTLYN